MVSRLRVGETLPVNAADEIKQLATQLRQARRRLAGMVSATPTPEQALTFRAALAEASESKEVLEKQLAGLNPATQRALEIRNATVNDLLKQLPAGVAVIDLVLLSDVDYVDEKITLKRVDGTTEERTVKRQKSVPVFYAFVLRSDASKEEDEAAVTWVQLGLSAPINTAVAAWRAQLTGIEDTSAVITNSVEVNAANKIDDPAQQLRALIWDKLEPELQGCNTVILLPDGDLHRLPWSALPGQKPGTFLIDDYALGTAAYGQQLFGLLSAEAVESSGQLLIAGGIRYDERREAAPASNSDNIPLLANLNRGINLSVEDRSWSYLTGTDQEGKAIQNLWADRGHSTLLAGLAADEQAVGDVLTRSRYAHLATHGFFDKTAEVYQVNLRELSQFKTEFAGGERGATVAARNPLLMSGIVLAGANLGPRKDKLGLPTSDDGILTAEEIVGLDLHNTELVTLSACETGLGDVAAGEGVFGLQRALHQAGARSVIASLWKVDDAATQVLMTEFYRHLWDEKLSKIEALRQAQLTMLRTYDPESGQLRGLGAKSEKIDTNKKPGPTSAAIRLDPRYWAAFQLSGDGR